MFLATFWSEPAWLYILFFSIIGLILVPYIFYLIILQSTLRLVAPINRKMEPGLVWLMLIPLVNVVWQFFVVGRLADSLEAEFRSRGWPLAERPGYNPGLAYCICFCSGWVPILGSLASIAGVVLWIIHWVKISEYRKRLINMPSAMQDKESAIFNV